MAANSTKPRSNFRTFVSALASIVGIFLLVGLARFGSQSLFVALLDSRQWSALPDRLAKDSDFARLKHEFSFLTGAKDDDGTSGASAKIRLATINFEDSWEWSGDRLHKTENTIRSKIASCAQAPNIIGHIRGVSFAPAVWIKRSDLAPEIRVLLDQVKPGTPTEPLEKTLSVQMFIACPA